MVWKKCAELGYEIFEEKGNEELKKALDYARWLWHNDFISDTIANAIDLKIFKEINKKNKAKKKPKEDHMNPPKEEGDD